MAGQNGNDSGVHRSTDSALERGEIAFRGRGGRRPRVLAHGGPGEKHLTLDERYVYWTDSDDGTVTRLPKDGGVPLVIASDEPQAAAITLADGWLYWFEHFGGSLFRVRKGGGEPEQLLDGNDDHWLMVRDFAVDERFVYWAARDSAKVGGAIFKIAK